MINQSSPRYQINYVGFIGLVLLSYACEVGTAYANPPSGIAPLLHTSRIEVTSSIAPATRPLLTPQQQITFMAELEGTPPDWEQLHNHPGEEHGERLFVFNRKRDEIREGHPLLTKRVAFLWTGILRHFIPEHKGFSVAMGPELTQTEWGIVRFKPMGLPDDMIAIPSPALLTVLREQHAADEEIQVGIIFAGRLIPDESIMYAFSHDGSEQGMIMPVVQIDGVGYFLETPNE
ncbi:MAG: hypothetical protein GKS05_07585 [Nitrospirales bacterium]|nr:hypothetical protein [Nitrospirales bacterium]